MIRLHYHMTFRSFFTRKTTLILVTKDPTCESHMYMRTASQPQQQYTKDTLVYHAALSSVKLA